MTRCVCATASADLRVPIFITFSCADGASEVVAIFFAGSRSIICRPQLTANFPAKSSLLVTVDVSYVSS